MSASSAMRSFALSTTAARSGLLRSTAPRSATLRSFTSFTALRASKETAEDGEARKAEIENAKQQQLREQKQGKNEWKHTLASESESVVKADRGEIKADKSTISELQKESAKAAQQEKK